MRRRKTKFADMLGIGADGDDRLRFLGEAARQWLALGEPAKAAQIYEGLILLCPNDPLGHLGLAEIHLAQGRFEEAAAATQLAIHAPNTDRRRMAYAYKLEGSALMNLGRWQNAAKSLRLACELDPDGFGVELANAWSASGTAANVGSEGFRESYLQKSDGTP